MSASGEINSICICISTDFICATGAGSQTFYTQRASLESAGNTIVKCSLASYVMPQSARAVEGHTFAISLCNLYGCVRLMRLVRKLSPPYGWRASSIWNLDNSSTLLRCKSLCCAESWNTNLKIAADNLNLRIKQILLNYNWPCWAIIIVDCK